MFLVQAAGAYGYTGARNQYAWFVWAFTTAIILGDAMAGQGDVETIAFERASMVGIGLLLVFVIDSVFWPTRSEPTLRASLAQRARQLAGALRRAIDPAHADPSSAPLEPSPAASQIGLIEAMAGEMTTSVARVESLSEVALLLEAATSRERLLREPVGWEATATFDESLRRLALRVEDALAEAARALHGGCEPSRWSSDLEDDLQIVEAECTRLGGVSQRTLRARGRVVELRDLVALLRTLERVLMKLPAQTVPAPASSPTSPRLTRFEVDPLRMRIALRTGIAVCGSFVVTLVLGWDVNTLVAPIAFMISATATRGGTTQTLIALMGVLAISWLLADLATVFFYPHAGRMPLALLYPAAVGGVFAYLRATRPQLAVLPSIGGLIAVLPIFSAMNAPVDVYGVYSTVCYMALGLGVGWLASRLLWPGTAATLFRKRLAAQVEFCLQGFREHVAGEDAAVRELRAAELLRDYTRQLTQIGPLHAQARHEPVERGLDEHRREQLLAVVRDLFDAVSVARGTPPVRSIPAFERIAADVDGLRRSLDRVDEALIAGMHRMLNTLRGGVSVPTSALTDAHHEALALVEELRAQPELWPHLEPGEWDALLAQLDSRHRLVNRQLAVEAWLDDWSRVELQLRTAADSDTPG